jgi:predicted nuclease of predicted toxin-antitoxin system
MAGADDVTQLAFAASAERVLVRQDSDFLRLHAKGVPHAGIAYCQQGSTSMGTILPSLVLIHDLLSPDEMAGRVEFL